MPGQQERLEAKAPVHVEAPAQARAASNATVLRKPGSATDPQWYKDAIIYELHVRAFQDGNGDGIGDFPGLLERLDYLQDLGVTAIWLLPFFPSPLKDDGYDISDYMNVHPNYGTLEDFKRFLDAAHERGLQVIIELVVNHTSDQHPWFQRARNAPAGSPERDFYVWSGTDQKYKEARIIFTDTEKSNWTWDPVAKAYFWHRFFSHQPDVNYDNPLVLEEMLKALRFWMDMGVDGIRLDAIPYLVEREGTNCENLAETHVLIKKLRAAIDAGYDGRMILAEANQWPADVRPYFGQGDECHMAFHFPLMPRIYMGLRQEDRLPIMDIMAQTPEIPDICQWALFLRNHDELTLEMVTEDERDYMYLAYSADPRMKINVGIRRRLAPLMDNNRRRIELLNSLLFSFPGTPILYYGDEIGMGDNIYLGDRNGVRTPMQWSPDRNAGFSKANPAKLYSPVVMDPIYGYEAVNVEAEQADTSSLLHWMRNMIALRKLFKVFGRGTLEFLEPPNRKVLAYVRRYDGETVVCVANLSRFAQPVQLDLKEFVGMVPVEMLGYVEFPQIEKGLYSLALGPYGFLWLELHAAAEQPGIPPADALAEPLRVAATDDWEAMFAGKNLQRLQEEILPEYLPRQRWFGAKSLEVKGVQILDWGRVPEADCVIVLAGVQSGTPDSKTPGSGAASAVAGAGETTRTDRYQMVLAMAKGNAADEIERAQAAAVVTRMFAGGEEALLYDATYDGICMSAVLDAVARSAESDMQAGKLRGRPSSMFAAVRGGDETLAPRHGIAEQSNTSVLFGERMIMKLFRRPEAGPNPDTEIGRYLTEKTSFDHIAPFAGSLDYERTGADTQTEPSTLGMVQGLVANEGDGWQWTLEELARFYESAMAAEFPAGERERNLRPVSDVRNSAVSDAAREFAGLSVAAAEALGRRTGELHAALAQPTEDPAFVAEPVTEEYLGSVAAGVVRMASDAFVTLMRLFPTLPEDAAEQAAVVLSHKRQLLEDLRWPASLALDGKRTRVHGDYHLGQVLRVKTDFVILDFEGEPARPLEERRRKHSPLKDVAGMLRSYSYAAQAGLMRYTERRADDRARLEPWARLWERSVASEFLRAYRAALAGTGVVPEGDAAFQRLLEVYLLEKALYELLYELNNRPAWVGIPLAGLAELAER
jgi:maltose alpha-D-glucosyltransferase/alpha-amylase